MNEAEAKTEAPNSKFQIPKVEFEWADIEKDRGEIDWGFD